MGVLQPPQARRGKLAPAGISRLDGRAAVPRTETGTGPGGHQEGCVLSCRCISDGRTRRYGRTGGGEEGRTRRMAAYSPYLLNTAYFGKSIPSVKSAENPSTARTWPAERAVTNIPYTPPSANTTMVNALMISSSLPGSEDQKCLRSRTIRTLNWLLKTRFKHKGAELLPFQMKIVPSHCDHDQSFHYQERPGNE